MRIAILNPVFFREIEEIHGKDSLIHGGAEVYFVALCKFLQSEGHHVDVYQAMPEAKNPIKKVYKGIPIICINPMGGWLYGTNVALNTVFNEFAQFYDLRIYFVTFAAWPVALSPCITISHGIFWDFPQDPYKNMTDTERKEFMRRNMYGFTNADICVSVDSNVRKFLQAYEPGSESRVHVIYNFADTEKYYPGNKTWDGIRVLCPRRLTIIRGCNDFVRAAREHPEYKFISMGQAHDADAQKNFADFYKSSNLEVTNAHMDDMPEVYRQADICVVPTRGAEGTSLSAIEGMASGLPLITTTVGGLGDLVIPGYNALVYDPNHESLSDYVSAMAEDKTMMEVMGRRNREIAVDCFDIKIWQAKWRNALMQLGIYPEADKPLIAGVDLGREPDNSAEAKFVQVEPKKVKLVAMMLTHNDGSRYLERVIENTLVFADEIAVLDDHSEDDTIDVLKDLAEEYPGRIHISNSIESWENEAALRHELLMFALAYDPTWLIAVDSDELFEADVLKAELDEIYKSGGVLKWVCFRFYDMWDDISHFRHDDLWRSGSWGPRMFRVEENEKMVFMQIKRHCGSIPSNMLKYRGMKSGARVMHLGYMKPNDRKKKYEEKVADDPENRFYSKEVYDAILDENPTLYVWGENGVTE
jgi:glycosyltransferase involved in cell wall biosynthesis